MPKTNGSVGVLTPQEDFDYVIYTHAVERVRGNQKMKQAMEISYRRATQVDIDIMTDLLFLLYNGEGLDSSRDELLVENEQILAKKSEVCYLAFDGDKPVAVSHGSLRYEYVNGANDGCKGYLEAIYVLPEYRKKGIAAELVRIIERWAVQNGCQEIASDCLLENVDSYNFHLKIGYEETERNIFFLKKLEPQKYNTCQVDDAVRGNC